MVVVKGQERVRNMTFGHSFTQPATERRQVPKGQAPGREGGSRTVISFRSWAVRSPTDSPAGPFSDKEIEVDKVK